MFVAREEPLKGGITCLKRCIRTINSCRSVRVECCFERNDKGLVWSQVFRSMWTPALTEGLDVSIHLAPLFKQVICCLRHNPLPHWNVAMHRSIIICMTGGVTALPYCFVCSRLLPSTTYVSGNAIARPISDGCNMRKEQSSTRGYTSVVVISAWRSRVVSVPIGSIMEWTLS